MVAAGVAVLVLIGWYALLWSPKGAALSSAKAAVTKADSGHQQLLGEIAGLEGLKRKLPAEAQNLRASLPSVPTNAGIPALIDQLQQTAASAGVTVTTESQAVGAAVITTASAPTPSSAASTVTVTLGIAGSYRQVVTFVHELEQSARLVVVDTLSLAATTGVVTATITGRAFYNPSAVPDLTKIGMKT